jgi:hypothetical protein
MGFAFSFSIYHNVLSPVAVAALRFIASAKTRVNLDAERLIRVR